MNLHTESPFLPGTAVQFAWDSTSLGWLKTCPRLYQYSMIEGWRSKSESVHLKFGAWYHSALELYDKLRVGYKDDYADEDEEPIIYSHDEAMQKVVETVLHWTWPKVPVEPPSLNNVPPERLADVMDRIANPPVIDKGPWISDHPLKTRENLIRSIIWYLDHFRDDPAQTIQLANGKPAVELSFRMELDYGPIEWETGNFLAADVQKQPKYVLCGHLDRLVSFTGGTYVMDRKTTSSALGSHYFDQYSPDNQMSLYSLAAKVIYSTPVKGVIIDAAELKVGFTRFGRGMTFRTEAELEEWLSETKHWLRLAEGFATEGYWPRNDRSCHQYGGCTFRKVCSKSPEVRQKFLESDFTKSPWNPLKAR